MTGGYSYNYEDYYYYYDSESDVDTKLSYSTYYNSGYSTYSYSGYSDSYLSSTEIYIPGQDYSWSFASPLPEPVAYLGSVSLYNNIYLIGK